MPEPLFVIDLGLKRSVRVKCTFYGYLEVHCLDFLGAVAPDLGRLLQLKELIEDRNNEWDTQSQFQSACDRKAAIDTYSWRDSSDDMMYTRHIWSDKIFSCLNLSRNTSDELDGITTKFITWDNERCEPCDKLSLYECEIVVQLVEEKIDTIIADIVLMVPDIEQILGITLRNVYDADIRENVLKVMSKIKCHIHDSDDHENRCNRQVFANLRLSSNGKKLSALKTVDRYQDGTSDWPKDPRDLNPGVNDTIQKFLQVHTINSSQNRRQTRDTYKKAKRDLHREHKSHMNKRIPR